MVFNKSYMTGCNVHKTTLNWLRIEETDIGILRQRFAAHCAPFSKHEVRHVVSTATQVILFPNPANIQLRLCGLVQRTSEDPTGNSTNNMCKDAIDV